MEEYEPCPECKLEVPYTMVLPNTGGKLCDYHNALAHDEWK